MPQPYIPPTLTVDAIIFQIIQGELQVLLIERQREPFKDAWALPGGYNAAGETTQEALTRVLATKAGLDTTSLDLIEQLYTFDTVARDPRGHAVSVTYTGLGKEIKLTTSPTTEEPQFFPVGQLPELAYDHKDIITYALERLRAKIGYTNAVFALLPEQFTLTQLQIAYQAILGTPLDKRNFRKKFLAIDLIEETAELQKDGAHRPARLYRFKQQGLQTLSRSFE